MVLESTSPPETPRLTPASPASGEGIENGRVPGFPPLPPRGSIFASQYSPRPPRRVPYAQRCYSLGMCRVYDDTLHCDKCGRGSDFGWFYRCTNEAETRLYESIQDGNIEHFDKTGRMFKEHLKQQTRGPRERADKLSLLDELNTEQLESLSGPQLAKLLKQRENANATAIRHKYGLLAPTVEDRPYLMSERQECKNTLCPHCGRGSTGEELSFLDLDGILRGDIPPTVAVGYSFRKHGRPIADADIVRNIGLRRVPEVRPKPSRPTSIESMEVNTSVLSEKEDDETVLQFHQPSTPSSTLIATNDSNDDLLQLYTDEDPDDVAYEGSFLELAPRGCPSKQDEVMPSDRTPLLADPRRSIDSARSDRRAEEEDSLVRGESPERRGWTDRLREIVLFIWALLATTVIIVLAVWIQHSQQTGPYSKPAGKRNLVFMVSDGMGPASLSLTRSYRQLVDGLDYGDTLTLDQHFWGTSRTRSSNRLVTDSAAGATAFACGKKSYNGAISVLPDYSPCGSVLEAAKKAGYKTGLVVTTDITDATPACFASHVNLREQEDEIALQEAGEGPLGRVVDLMLGGGRCHFLPNSTEGSCRLDDVDVTKIAQEKHGWTYLNDRAGFDSMFGGQNVSLPLMGLFASTDVPFEIDRKNMADVYPSLSEMATTALRALQKATQDSDKGFFLMIEGSRIDHAGHINDPASQVREVLEYDKTFKAVVDFLEKGKTEGMLVATSDHETGGLATAWQSPDAALPVYNWHPSVLAKANASAQYLASKLHRHIESIKSNPAALDELESWINKTLVVPGLGITDARDSELKKLASDPTYAIYTFSKMISQRARIGWSTHGHSAVDVNIYSSGGPHAEDLHGNVENTDVGKFLRNYLDVDVDSVTEQLKEEMDWERTSAISSDETMVGYEAGVSSMDWID